MSVGLSAAPAAAAPGPRIESLWRRPLVASLPWLLPHRLALALALLALVVIGIDAGRWDWLERILPRWITPIPERISPNHWLIPGLGLLDPGMLLAGIWRTIWILVVTAALGLALAIPLGLVQVTGPRWLALPAEGFCSLIRGTPLLIQLWLLYYGLGSIFPLIPEIRQSWLWPILRQGWPFAVLGMTLSFAGYAGEILRGAFAGTPRGQLEAAKAFGMSRFTAFRRIWLPQALLRAMPTLGGETILQLKSTPLVATITVVDLYEVSRQVRQQTYLSYEPLALVALIYLILAGLIAFGSSWLERRVPNRLG